MNKKTPFANADAYKLSHWIQYPEKVSYVYSNFTPRRSLRAGIDYFVFFGLQAFLYKLVSVFQRDFFALGRNTAIENFVSFYTGFFGGAPTEAQVQAVESLHILGYLPLRFYALPEGSVVPHNVPVLTIESTHPDFAWMTNFVESWLSAELWQPSTSATTALYYRMQFDRYADKTSEQPWMPDFQGHDFSFRGMAGLEAAAASGAGHLLSFKGTDTLPAIGWIDEFYSGSPAGTLIGTSVPATEHSVMCAGGEECEIDTFRRLLKLYPTGILSVVSDTWDFWKVVCEILPQLKDEIMARDGKLVIRPDSSPKTPVEIICGDPDATVDTPEHHGLIPILGGIFGTTINTKGYKELDSHIGAIYGDSITLDYQKRILQGLADKGYASTNVVLGIGSYTYQYVTRDTHGLAMKATAVGDREGNITPIFKDPKTDTSGKKSARGLLAVDKVNGVYVLTQDATPEHAFGCAFNVVFEDGEVMEHQSFVDVRRVLEEHKAAML